MRQVSRAYVSKRIIGRHDWLHSTIRVCDSGSEPPRGQTMTSHSARIVFGVLVGNGTEIAEACVPELPATAPAPGSTLLSHLRQKLLSDEQLAEQLQAGHADALTILFERHSGRIFGIARRILRNDAEAEDAVQTIFLDAYRAIDQFNADKGEFKTWLLMFAYQRTFNRRRHLFASRFFVSEPLDILDEILPEILRAWQRGSAYSQGENRILIQQVMRSLEPRQRRTIELIYFVGFTAEEVAAQTGETVRVVRHNLYRGLEKLRKAIFNGDARGHSIGKRGSR
jgi:RNA polymerase sigma-70 factor, ECF subfamily